METTLYNVVIKESVNGEFWGYIKDRPNIMSQGETKEELIEMLRDALKLMTIYEHELKNNRIN